MPATWGAMLTLVVVVVGDIQIAIDVVLAEGGLAVGCKDLQRRGTARCRLPADRHSAASSRADFFGIQKLVGNPFSLDA